MEPVPRYHEKSDTISFPQVIVERGELEDMLNAYRSKTFIALRTLSKHRGLSYHRFLGIHTSYNKKGDLIQQNFILPADQCRDGKGDPRPRLTRFCNKLEEEMGKTA